MIPEADGEAETTVFVLAVQRLAQCEHVQDCLLASESSARQGRNSVEAWHSTALDVEGW